VDKQKRKKKMMMKEKEKEQQAPSDQRLGSRSSSIDLDQDQRKSAASTPTGSSSADQQQRMTIASLLACQTTAGYWELTPEFEGLVRTNGQVMSDLMLNMDLGFFPAHSDAFMRCVATALALAVLKHYCDGGTRVQVDKALRLALTYLNKAWSSICNELTRKVGGTAVDGLLKAAAARWLVSSSF